jgi:hypothetical protein
VCNFVSVSSYVVMFTLLFSRVILFNLQSVHSVEVTL